MCRQLGVDQTAASVSASARFFAFVPASVGAGFQWEALKSLQPNDMWVKSSLKVRCRSLTGNLAGGITAAFGVTFERCNL